MANAQRAGGLYFVNGVAVDANGVAVPDAPAPAPDTIPKPPADASKTLAEQIAEGVVKGMTDGTAAAAALSDTKPASKK